MGEYKFIDYICIFWLMHTFFVYFHISQDALTYVTHSLVNVCKVSIIEIVNIHFPVLVDVCAHLPVNVHHIFPFCTITVTSSCNFKYITTNYFYTCVF